MNLTAAEKTWLAGEGGPALRRAMEIIVALGKINELLPISEISAQIRLGIRYSCDAKAQIDFSIPNQGRYDRIQAGAGMSASPTRTAESQR